MGWRWNVAVGNDDVLMVSFLGWIAREQNSPYRVHANPSLLANVLMTKEGQLENSGFEQPTRVNASKWLTKICR